MALDFAFALIPKSESQPARVECTALAGLTTDFTWTLFINGSSSATEVGVNFTVPLTIMGEYAIVLSSSAESITRKFVAIDESQFRVYTSINSLVEQILNDTIDNAIVNALKTHYQEILFPAVAKFCEGIGYILDESNKFNELAWPSLANILIANLIVRGIILASLESQLTGKGGVSRILTGPTEVRIYPSAALLSEAVKNGSFVLVQNQICSLGKLMGITFSGCPADPYPPIRLDTSYTPVPIYEINSLYEIPPSVG